MHPPDRLDPDPALSSLLHRADPADDLLDGQDPLNLYTNPKIFASQVKRRLQTTTPPLGPRHTLATLSRNLFPLAAALTLMASLALGAAGAWLLHRDAHRDYYATAYARSIDPLLMHTTRAAP